MAMSSSKCVDSEGHGGGSPPVYCGYQEKNQNMGGPQVRRNMVVAYNNPPSQHHLDDEIVIEGISEVMDICRETVGIFTLVQIHPKKGPIASIIEILMLRRQTSNYFRKLGEIADVISRLTWDRLNVQALHDEDGGFFDEAFLGSAFYFLVCSSIFQSSCIITD
ncbi:hypothetical protein RHMOL_Rhmol09G0198000 [Rhododendron molle]|uniref:Uncharacterized protein n=1 Tax=Rhododendron molle TaxID=49168 RepID=A0ACC0MGB1_RHOML|nr:hypothetical protein RHMOL_Rhmol09G0198000 [Rhododendron molle]